MKIHDIIALLGGIALFLFGLQLMVNKLERVFGRFLRALVPVMAKNRVAGFFAGTVMTGALQSSSAVTAMTVGMAHSGALTIGCALGVILGANVGSTATGFLLCVDTQWSMAIAALGLVLVVISRRDRSRQAGQLLISASLMLWGLKLMTESMEPLKAWEGVTYLAMGMDYPVLSVLLGACVAALLQSSAATLGILQALAMQGVLPLHTAFYALLGANIGTCVTALIASSGANAPARRAAAVHVLFNLLTAALATAAMRYLPVLDCAEALCGQANGQLALLHAALNVSGAVVWLILSPVLLLLSRLLARGKAEGNVLAHYDERQLSVPAVALYQLEKEVERLGEKAADGMQRAMDCWQGMADAGEETGCAEIAKAIAQGLLLAQGKTSNERDSARIAQLLQATTQFEYAARHAAAWAQLSDKRADFSEEELDDLLLFAHKALGAVEAAQQNIFARRISDEEKQAMQLLLADADSCARELQEKYAGRASCQIALQEIACVQEAMGQLLGE